ncbi:MAG TPA: glycoside hydrolase family 2 protein, partial [Bacteroidales bacterium]
ALHYFVKEAYENTMLTSFEENGKLTVHCISDLDKQDEATLTMQLMDFDGKVLWQDSLSFLTPSNSSLPVFEISTAEYFKKGNPSAMLLVSEIQIPGRKNFIDLHYFAPPKDLQLKKPEISVQVLEEKGNFIVQVSSDKLVKNIFLSAGSFPGRFSNNFFDVLPGKAYSVSIPKNGDLKDFEKKLTLMHLQQTMK